MVPGGVTEILWHFIGQLRSFEDIAQDRLVYDTPALPAQLDDYTTKRPDFDTNPDLDEFSTSPLLPPQIDLFEDRFAARLPQLKAAHTPPVDDDDSPFPVRLLPPQIAFSGGGGGGGSEFHIKVVYEPGGEQGEFLVSQTNMLIDDDMQVIAPASQLPLLMMQAAEIHFEANSLLLKMADEANHQIPNDWWVPKDNDGALALVKHIDQLDSEGVSDPHSVTPGYYLNGELQTPPPDPPAPQLGDDTPHDTGHGLGLWAEAGGNISFNGALIVDLGASAHTMVVLGDYFHTDAIFQTNSTMDHDVVTANGNALPAAATGQDVATNIADFVQHPGVFTDIPVTFAGPHWHVDVVDGNYYSVHTSSQVNYVSDNDIVVQDGGSNHFDLVSGDNQTGNIMKLFDGSVHYDLIVVEGAYHGMNVIFQNNILLNNDDIALLTNGGADPSQSVSAGQNELLNAATIENYGGNNFLPMNDGVHNLIGALQQGDSLLDPEMGSILPGSGGTFNVLYIKGDYYDVNAMWQTNVMSDVNVLVQLMSAPNTLAAEQHPGDNGTQSVTTGQDKLTNDATIVDVGPTDTYVGGHTYNDTILVQANLLPTDSDQGLVKDTTSLVPELIAFVDDTQHEQAAAQPAPPPPSHDDAMANIMH